VHLFRKIVPALFVATAVSAAEIKVSSLADLQTALGHAVPGTRIVVANGVYTSTNAIRVACQGRASKPIVIAAETNGGVEINGGRGFMLSKPAAYVTIEGFKFTHETGIEQSGGGELIEAGTSHCRFTRNVFELSGKGRGYYLMIAGDDVEIDHNSFQNKFTVGQMIIIHGPGTKQMAQRTWIHQNLFTNFPNTHQNNCSAIQIGVSGRSLSSAHALVERNLFLGCRGENENICNKSCDNIYRFNTFGADCSELSLRHGDRNLVYANFFIGSEGLRIFGKKDRIFSNYFQDCRRGIHIGNGDGVVPEDKLTSHDRPDGTQIVFNTIVNCANSVMMQARPRNGLGATNIIFADNIVVGAGKLISIDGPMTHSVWRGNMLWSGTNDLGSLPTGTFTFTIADPRLQPGADGVYRLQTNSPAIGQGGIWRYRYASVDMDGQGRGWKRDVGADEFSGAPASNHILTPAEVGPGAP